MKQIRRFFTEYLFLNLFIWSCVGLLSFVILNVSFFDPFTEAFKDFTLTDLYYSKVKNQDRIYEGPLVLVNVENRDRKEISFLLQRIAEGNPKVTGIDIIFKERRNEDDSLLQQQLQQRNYVFSYIADFENDKNTVTTNEFFPVSKKGYANLLGEEKENTTVRYYYPFYNNQASFTTAILQAYDSAIYKRLSLQEFGKKEIHYWGNLPNFRYYHFDEIMHPQFDTEALKDKIVLIGYLGNEENGKYYKLDEDKFFTPFNDQLSGRSYPDMFGCVIHANILRMILDNDSIKVVPQWKVILISFLAIWLLLPLMCGLFFKGDVWFNAAGTLVQLIGSVLIVFLSLLIYRHFNTKFDPGLLTASLVLLPTFINLYEAFLMFLYYKLKLPIRSRFINQEK